jgi:leucyl aminopeptidase
MEFFIRSGIPSKQKTGCAILGVFDGDGYSGPGDHFNKISGGLLSSLKKQGDLPVRPGQTLVVQDPKGLACKRLLLIGCGKRKNFLVPSFKSAISLSMSRLGGLGATDAICYMAPEGVDTYAKTRHAVEAVETALYRCDEMKSGKKKPAPRLKKFGIALADDARRRCAAKAVEHASAISKGQLAARTLANLPANICTPSYLAAYARKLATGNGRMKATILGEAEMKKLRMGSLLSVTAGAKEPAKLIVLQYTGVKRQAPIALVGKGVTFDTGGISLKPPQAMDEMKFDMGGAAGVLGTMTAIAELKPEINVVAIVPACENMPGSQATRPGDIVRSMSGKTIEILNTDAEGRLILCDALTYARRFKPSTVIDVATLTGACVIALGHHLTGVMTKSDKLAQELLEAGKAAEDEAWRLPVTEIYDRELKSNFADFPNVTGREGGAITAACFLSRFTEGLEWAHMDVAGTAWKSGVAKGATGRPVPLLVEFLLGRAAKR